MSEIKQIYTSFFENDEYLAEEIFNLDLQPSVQFLCYSKDNDSLEIIESFEANYQGKNRKICPIRSNLIENKTVLLPSAIDQKTSESELNTKILYFVQKWLDIDEKLELINLHYIKVTWIYDRLTVVPYLRALGDYGSGKTRFIQTIGSLCYKPIFLAGATSDAYIFRTIELFKGTMVINELERLNTDLNAQIVNILNNGYEKGMGVGRVEGDKDKTPKVYDVFCPKIISAREPFKDLALESRIITNYLYPTSRRDIQIALDDSFWKEAEEIRNALLSYRLEYIKDRRFADSQAGGGKSEATNLASLSLSKAKREALNSVEPRLRQTFYPIFLIIPDSNLNQFTDFVKDYQKETIENRRFELDGIVAKCLFQLLDELEESSLRELRARVNEELDSDKFKISPQKLGKILKSWGLKTRPIGHDNIQYIVNNESAFKRLRSRFGIFDNAQEIASSTANPQVDREEEQFLDQAELLLKERKNDVNNEQLDFLKLRGGE